MSFYKDTPQRRLAQSAPRARPAVPLKPWCGLDPKREGPLPIDDSDGGCESPGKSFRAWSRQIDTIRIEPGDAVTDSAEAYDLMRQRGIEQVAVLGVHTNMCVLGRPFGIRQLVSQGLEVVLVRDLTDTMYNPERAPRVSHFTGTDLVVEHIEQYWCPSVTSADFLGGREFRFAADRRPLVVVVAADDEYKTEKAWADFALGHLGRDYRVRFVYADAQSPHRLPGLEVLAEADLAIFNLRRRPLVREQLEGVRRFFASGKPAVAVRTASHGFAARPGQPLPAGIDQWPDFDRAVLGCTYKGHHGNHLKCTVAVVAGIKDHPLLAGVDPAGFTAAGSLYRSVPLAEDAVVLLEGRVEGAAPEPVAWVRTRRDGGRLFSTSLGAGGDFKNPSFIALLKNGIDWGLGKDRRQK